MIQRAILKPSVQSDFLLHQAQLLINAAKQRDIKKQSAVIEIRKALSSNNFDWV